ncbi:snRNA-activating protein complex subunit 3 isoform X2 [Lingula anatina]|uniref:snRNA-activating protein complex subunit 3 n=1 Tax=Lingula anatina TaxID=7574 RepID=A0A1S3J6Z3_LINAN|nr:snRNA-activating protein complex subunit 3 isoform X2 [Lingula anatina]|eukprot:XP_013406021.1 snRNA-activating protein complex subunit 3 isoform X2 [Lingula anatina]
MCGPVITIRTQRSLVVIYLIINRSNFDLTTNMAAPTREGTANDVLDVRQFLEGWAGLVGNSQLQKHEDDDQEAKIANDMSISREMVEELASVCSTDTLLCGSEPEEGNLTAFPEVNLLTVRCQEESVQKRENDNIFRTKVSRKMRYKYVQTLAPPCQSEGSIECPIKIPETFLDQEFQVIGSNTLTDLRDKYSCVADFSVPGEFSEDPDMPQDNRAKDLFKSGFFFIEGTFYNDMRYDDCRDYSKVIIDWAKEKERGLGPYTSAKMETTRFVDLKLRLGQPYVYLHQGECEHLVVFSDLRLHGADDPQDAKAYPLLVHKSKPRRQLCIACQTMTARWIVHGSPLAPEDPSHFCDVCFKMLHYDKNKKKLVEFKAFPFLDKTAVF